MSSASNMQILPLGDRNKRMAEMKAFAVKNAHCTDANHKKKICSITQARDTARCCAVVAVAVVAAAADCTLHKLSNQCCRCEKDVQELIARLDDGFVQSGKESEKDTDAEVAEADVGAV